METDDTTSKVHGLLQILMGEDSEPGAVGRTVAAAHALAHLGQPGIEALARVLRDWGDYSYMAFLAAIEALGDSGDARAVTPLRNVMRMPPRGREMSDELRAANALAHLEGKGASALADITQTRSMDPNTRWAAATFLGETGDEETALAPLFAALGDREDPLGAAGAATSLGKLHSTEAIPALIAALDDEEYEFVANDAQGALYHIGEAAIPALAQALSDAPDEARRRAAWALSWLGGILQARDALFSALGNPDADVRAAAVCALRNYGDTGALPALQRIRQEDEGVSADFEPVAELANEAIRAIEARAAGLEDPSPRDEELATTEDASLDEGIPLYLEDIPLDWADERPNDINGEIARLSELLTAQINSEEDTERSVGAALSLARLGPQGLDVLARVARDAGYDDDVRAAALDGLVSSGDETVALAPLLAVLNSTGDSWLGIQAAHALGALGSAATIPGLVAALIDEQYGGIGAIEDSLVRIGEASIPALVAVLTHGPDSQRRAAARVLREMSADPRATVAFFATLSDPDPKIRELAVEAIAFPHDGASSQNQDDSEPQDSFRDDPAAARALLPLLDDPVEPVRAATRNGLRAVGGPDDAALLERIARFSGSGDEVSGALANTATAAGSTDFSAEIVGYLRLLTCGVGGGSDIRAAWRAAQALGRLDVQGVAALAAVLRDPDLYPRTSRIWAIEALDASENTQAIPALLDALRGVVPDSSVEGYFADLPDDRSLGEELRAAHALVRLGEAGITALEEVLRDQGASARTRWAARDALDSLPRDTDATDRPL